MEFKKVDKRDWGLIIKENGEEWLELPNRETIKKLKDIELIESKSNDEYTIRTKKELMPIS